MKSFIWSCVVIIDYYNNIKLQWDGKDIHMIALLTIEFKGNTAFTFSERHWTSAKSGRSKKNDNNVRRGHFMYFMRIDMAHSSILISTSDFWLAHQATLNIIFRPNYN